MTTDEMIVEYEAWCKFNGEPKKICPNCGRETYRKYCPYCDGAGVKDIELTGDPLIDQYRYLEARGESVDPDELFGSESEPVIPGDKGGS
jgi:predicted amidophosphoribosyltransferase